MHIRKFIFLFEIAAIFSLSPLLFPVFAQLVGALIIFPNSLHLASMTSYSEEQAIFNAYFAAHFRAANDPFRLNLASKNTVTFFIPTGSLMKVGFFDL
jgi:hypothetical protein